MPDLKSLITIGKIVRPTGVKGEVKVIPLTDFPDRFKLLKSVNILDKNEKFLLVNFKTDNIFFEIENTLISNNSVRIKFSGFESYESADTLRDAFVVIDEKERIKLEKNRFYYYEVIDSGVFEDEKEIGTVVNIINYGGNDLLEIKLPDSNTTAYIPLVEDFVKKIDLKKKQVHVKLIDGLI